MVKVAVTQFSCSWDWESNVQKAEKYVAAAAAEGAKLILIQELFEAPYFCRHQRAEYLQLAKPADLSENPLLARMQLLAKEHEVVLPISFYELDGVARYNSVIVFDSDGSVAGLYRKSHIPDGPGYSEKFYFSPGDTGFRVFNTTVGRVGVAICWDQWFPEAARAMALAGAQILCYPTAIGSEPPDASADTARQWRHAMLGHSSSNVIPVLASNRVGTETDGDDDKMAITFYGTSFISSANGAILAEIDRTMETYITADIDLKAADAMRAGWGVFRDRRPDLYGSLLSLSGRPENARTLLGGMQGSPIATPHAAAPQPVGLAAAGTAYGGPAATAAAAAAAGSVAAPPRSGLVVPGEFERQLRCWLLWPHNAETWPKGAVAARAGFKEVVEAIVIGGQPVTVIARAEDEADAKAAFASLPEGDVAVVVAPSGDSWARDSLPTFARGGGGVDWTYNGYGALYTGWELDDRHPERVLRGLEQTRFRSPLVTEGGAIESDGDGTVICTAQSILNPNRNPELPRSKVEALIKAATGCRRVVWLPLGLTADHDTDGHVDNLCRFYAPGKVLLAWTDEPTSPDYYVVRQAEDALRAAEIEVTRLYLPAVPVQATAEQLGDEPFRYPVGTVLAATYANFLITTSSVVVPAFGGANAASDQAAQDVLQAAFPDRTIRPIHRASDILIGGGNVHCIVQSQFA